MGTRPAAASRAVRPSAHPGTGSGQPIGGVHPGDRAVDPTREPEAASRAIRPIQGQAAASRAVRPTREPAAASRAVRASWGPVAASRAVELAHLQLVTQKLRDPGWVKHQRQQSRPAFGVLGAPGAPSTPSTQCSNLITIQSRITDKKDDLNYPRIHGQNRASRMEEKS